jgi:hypothetical protein
MSIDEICQQNYLERKAAQQAAFLSNAVAAHLLHAIDQEHDHQREYNRMMLRSAHEDAQRERRGF